MSAIFGILNINGDPVEEKYLLKMKEKIGHYGPDDQGILLQDDIGIGCCLKNISRYSSGDIPVLYDHQQEILLAGDAVIYNREELIQKYLHILNKEVSTQELLLAAYMKWGEDCPRYLNGDFTFMIWEKKKKRLLLIRDHLGVRPMYYFYNRQTLAFASDYRALLALPYVGKQIDEVRLYALLSDTYHIDTEATYFTQIKRLPQAHILYFDGQGIHIKKYWTPGAGKKLTYGSEEEYAAELYKLVRNAIRLRIDQIAGGVVSEFSGGLDSSVVTVLANRELMAYNKKLTAYSWSPSIELLEEQKKDERILIRKVSEEEGFECRFRSSYPAAEQELACEAALTDGYRSEGLRTIIKEIASQEKEAIISGWGGDEGISHRADIIELLLAGSIGCFLKEALILARGSFLRLLKVLLSVPVILLFRPYSIFGMQNKGIPGIMNKKYEKRVRKLCKRNILKFKINPVKHIESGVSVSRTEITAWLGADYQIQYFFPFLDFCVVDFAMSIPRHLYYKQAVSRYIFRKAFERILPHELCYNQSKIDIANEIFLKNTDHSQESAEKTAARINRELFASYIDWDKVDCLLEQKYFLKATRGSIFTLLKLQVCHDIQRIIEDAEKG